MKKFHFQMTNKEFSNEVKSFYNACVDSGIKATKRQASKWRNKKGKAFKLANGLI